ncbi:hypothetical protein [Sporomusa sp.]|uniref:hypothetical protein n=1 Tax=Sporomusa sp. TaxID=2078658 RepID=UPI002C2EAFC4|nr:hypothetical protein [Sporomusa sp.]HWR43526.1 hypothetical protein [Sporomusa sp.]
MTEILIRRLTMSSHETPVAAHRKPVLFAVCCLTGRAHGHGGQTRAAAPRANGPAGSMGAADCAAGKIKRPPHLKAVRYQSKAGNRYLFFDLEEYAIIIVQAARGTVSPHPFLERGWCL